MVHISVKNDLSVCFNCRILRTSVNLKKLDVRGLKRISPEGIQVHFVNVFQLQYYIKRFFCQGGCVLGEYINNASEETDITLIFICFSELAGFFARGAAFLRH